MTMRRGRTTLAVTVAMSMAAAVATAEAFVGSWMTGMNGWDWIGFAQDVARNGVLALGVVGVVALLRMPRPVREQPPSAATTDDLVRELSAVADLADDLEAARITAPARRSPDDTFEYLDAVRWSLANYVVRTDRTRMLLAAGIAHSPRTGAEELARAVRHTNTVVAQWLVAHRAAVANPYYLDSNALFDRYRSAGCEAMLPEDPVYLLVCHLHDVFEAFETDDESGHSGDIDGSLLEHLQVQLTLPLQAVHREVAAMMAHHTAALRAIRTTAVPARQRAG